MKKQFNWFIRKLNISQIIVLAFVGVILIGTMLLCLPSASRTGSSNGFMTALFTATSATCVTGLALGDTYCQWSAFGQLVLLFLIQIGGLGFMSVGSLLFLALKKQFDLKPLLIMAQSVGTENLADVIRIQKKLLLGGFSIEAIGALILTLRFTKWYSFSRAMWLGVFHSVSAFCNAGFDVLGFAYPGESLIQFNEDSVIMLTLSFLIILGGLGFVVWDDLTKKKRPFRLHVYTKMVLSITFVLLIVGTIVYTIVEYENVRTIGNMNFGGKVLNAFFQSVTTRTAGFAGIDQGSLTETGKIFTIFLMFIGGASGSTAGGLKVVTFAVIVLFLLSRLRGKSDVNFFGCRFSETQIMDALCLFGMMTILSFAGAIIICGTTNFRFVDGLYETVSALATAGLSVGVLSGIGVVSKLLLIIYMFFGKIGILTISMGFLQKSTKKDKIRYPETNLPIG